MIRRSATRSAAAFATVGSVVLCACESGDSARSAPYTPHFGQSAVVVARHIPACSQIRASPVPPKVSTRAGLRAAGTAATCVIDNHVVEIDVWRDAAIAPKAISTLGKSHAWATGNAWMVTIKDQAPLAGQRDVANKVVSALGGKVVTTH